MKRLNGYKMKTVLVAFAAVVVISGGSAKADFTFSEPTNLGPTINWRVQDNGASLSANGLSLFFGSDYPDAGYWKLFLVTRESTDAPWGDRVKLGPEVNSSNINNWEPSISSDGLELYFGRGDRGKGIQIDLYVATRETTNDSWRTATSLGETVNTAANEDEPAISGDGLSLFFSSNRPGGLGGIDLWVTTRSSKQDVWNVPINLGPTVNSSNDDFAPSITSDGLTLIFSSKRPGKYSSYADLWMAKRRTPADPWGEPINLGPIINTDDVDYADISPDGRQLILSCFKRPGGYGYYDLWQSSITPIVDLNADGIVDASDMVIMVDNWGTDNSLCDIGPTPMGDGIVDVEDLKVLAEHLFDDYRLTAHWKLDETNGDIAHDSIGDNDGTCHGGPVWQPDGGKVGGSLQLDGVDDYISTPFILNPNKGSFSIFAWIKGVAPGQVIISQSDLGRDQGNTWLLADASYGRLMTRLMHPPFPPLVSESVITDDQWHHVGLVFDFIALHRYLYVDGIEVAKDSDYVGGIGSDGGLYIGADKTLDAVSFFSGLIDDVRIYNNVLSAEEIEASVK